MHDAGSHVYFFVYHYALACVFLCVSVHEIELKGSLLINESCTASFDVCHACHVRRQPLLNAISAISVAMHVPSVSILNTHTSVLSY